MSRAWATPRSVGSPGPPVVGRVDDREERDAQSDGARLEEEPPTQRGAELRAPAPTNAAGLLPAPESVTRALAGPGPLLDAATRSSRGRRLGYDFSHVRVHAGSAATLAARDLGALASSIATTGPDFAAAASTAPPSPSPPAGTCAASALTCSPAAPRSSLARAETKTAGCPPRRCFGPGRAPHRHARIDTASHLTQALGELAISNDDAERPPYSARFNQGANLVPRLMSRIERTAATALGAPAGRAGIRSKRSATEKIPWKDQPSMTGTVETEFL